MGLPGRGMSNVLCANIWLSLTKLLAFLMSDIYEKEKNASLNSATLRLVISDITKKTS
jgi:hypothetical protein